MKHLDKLIPMAMGLAMLTSCADNDMPFFAVTDPGTNAEYAYLNEYDVLKNYINPNANPNFKLGLGVDAGSFDAGNAQYQIAATNFNEVTPGNEMKYASIVANDGTMNFSTVANFVDDCKAANLTIYGHTLAWHSQQNLTYLNGLIADKEILPDPEDMNHYLLLHQDAAVAPWDGQVYYTMTAPLSAGTEYTFRFRAKASQPFHFQFWRMAADGSDVQEHSADITTGWEEYSFTFTAASAETAVKLVVGELVGDFCVDDMSLTAAGSDDNLISNGDFEDSALTNWTKYAWHSVTFSQAADKESGGAPGYCLVLTNSTMQEQNWGAQVWYQLSSPLKAGTTYTFTCMAKADEAYSLSPYLQSTTTSDQMYPAGFNITTNWAEASVTFTPDKDVYDKFTFNFGNFVGKIYIDDVKLVENGTSLNLVDNGDFEDANVDGWSSWSGYQSLSAMGEGYSSGITIIELTPEEKKEILTTAMDTWITGIMNATGGYVTTWDAVNEAISAADYENPDDPSDPHIGYYDLQTSENGDPSTNFYWQDYLGKEDYVPIVTKLATQRFEEAGGDPSQLKLFINDYNLESWWDGNKKLKSLIHWIETWEANGAKIDGIGTQMHVSYILNPTDQKAQEDAIVNMFQLLASTGKLIKITELDMGIVDVAFADGKKTEEVTYEEQLKMADFYKFIIEKYFEIIPQAQQYGITQWCCTYSPADSGWRAGEPCGLWDSNYNRTPMYGGFANGLAGKVIVEPSPVPGDGSDAGAVEETPAN